MKVGGLESLRARQRSHRSGPCRVEQARPRIAVQVPDLSQFLTALDDLVDSGERGLARCRSSSLAWTRAAAAAPFPRSRRRAVPAVTPSADRAWPEQPTHSRCAGRSCRRESSQSRALRPAAFASLRFAPGRPLTATFPGKDRHLPGGRGIEPGPGMGQVSGARLQADGGAQVSSAEEFVLLTYFL
jgi:hypothetical protein